MAFDRKHNIKHVKCTLGNHEPSKFIYIPKSFTKPMWRFPEIA